MEINFTPIYPHIFSCESCDFKCYKKRDWDRHIITRKHVSQSQWKKMEKNGNEKSPLLKCECNKEYKSISGLWKHKKICESIHPVSLDTSLDVSLDVSLDTSQISSELIVEILKQNSEFQNMLLEQHKTIVEMSKNNSNTLINNNNNSNNSNNNNKTFNLQFFLNETCKDAMNITDFVDSISLELSDLENVGKLGYVDGISNIILKNMKALDVEKRPVHCTDSKREIMYVKDQGKWYNDSKEDENHENKKLKRAIKHISNKNSKLLSEFKAKYPDCIYSYSTKSDQYNKLIIESFGGSGNNTIDNENKIIKKLAKDLTIAK